MFCCRLQISVQTARAVYWSLLFLCGMAPLQAEETDLKILPAAPAEQEVGQGWRIVPQGALTLPDHAPDADGKQVLITGLSGIAWLGEDRYASVLDNSNRLLLFRVSLSQVGKPLEVRSLSIVTLAEAHDYEDLVACPTETALAYEKKPPHAPSGDTHRTAFEAVFICDEDTPAIRIFSLADGNLLGTVPLPPLLSSRRDNRGLESLAIDPDHSHLWTANEEALAEDGPLATVTAGTVVRLVRLPMPLPAGGSEKLKPAAQERHHYQAAYKVDPPHRFVRVFGGEPLSGLSALVSLGNGQLLALERSGGPGLPPFANRIFIVDTTEAVDVSKIQSDLHSQEECFARKRLLWADSLGVNLEGFCLGPTLADGNRALIAIADNGGIATPNQLVGLQLVSPPKPHSRAVVGAACAIIAISLLLGRMSSVATRRLTNP